MAETENEKSQLICLNFVLVVLLIITYLLVQSYFSAVECWGGATRQFRHEFVVPSHFPGLEDRDTECLDSAARSATRTTRHGDVP